MPGFPTLIPTRRRAAAVATAASLVVAAGAVTALAGSPAEPSLGAAAPAAAPLYADDFEDPASGWNVSDNGTTKYGYLDGTYQILTRTTDRIGYTIHGPDLGDLDAQVEARAVAVAGRQDVGLIFRARDIDNLYLFQVNPLEGRYSLYLRDAGTWVELVAPTSSDAIRQGDAWNTLRVVARGAEIELFVNGTELTTIPNGALAGGRVGLSIQNIADPDGADARFDNLTVYRPGERVPEGVFLPALLRDAGFGPPVVPPTTTPPPTPFATSTPTLAPTPTPTEEPAGPPGIYGWVTDRGQPAVGITLTLRAYDAQGQNIVSQTTIQAADGGYFFINVPDLPAGKTYFVRFGPNDGDDRRVYSWYGPDVEAYRAGQRVFGGNFDIGDIELVEPSPNVTVRAPVTFRWNVRPVEDTYQWRMFDFEEDVKLEHRRSGPRRRGHHRRPGGRSPWPRLRVDRAGLDRRVQLRGRVLLQPLPLRGAGRRPGRGRLVGRPARNPQGAGAGFGRSAGAGCRRTEPATVDIGEPTQAWARHYTSHDCRDQAVSGVWPCPLSATSHAAVVFLAWRKP